MWIVAHLESRALVLPIAGSRANRTVLEARGASTHRGIRCAGAEIHSIEHLIQQTSRNFGAGPCSIQIISKPVVDEILRVQI
jgi:hypothetical protein